MKTVIVVFLFFSINCFATSVAKNPQLTFIGKRIINLGVVKEGKTIDQKIFFTNSGNSPLVILDITRSCNCAKVILKESKTNPRDTNYVSITIATKGKIGLNVIDVVLNTNTQQKEHVVKVLMEVEK